MSAVAPLGEVLPERRVRILAYKAAPVRQTIRMERFITSEPLELEYLYTVLETEEMTLLDGMTDRRDPVAVAQKTGAEIVLLSSFITNVEMVLEVARRLKRLPSAPLVFVGGPHAEVVPEDFVSSDVDGIFFASQLAGIRAAVDRIKRGERFDDLPGAMFRGEGDGWTKNAGPPDDAATFPVPKRILFEAAPERYHYLYFDRCASVKTAFGCHESCIFCFCTEQHGGKFGPRPIAAAVDEIAGISAKNVFILDDNFLSSRNRVREFCRLVAERQLEKRFIIYGGADFVARNPDLMRDLRQAGVEGLIVGFEFVTDGALVTVQKSARLADNDRTVEICRELGIELFALFVVDPDWRPEDFRRLRDYVAEREIAFATFSTYTVFPGTQLARLYPNAPGIPSWRFDLLRLHKPPRHMSALRYYLWLFYLYLLPGTNPKTIRKLARLYGPVGYLKLLIQSWVVGVEFLVKLAIWR